MYGNTHKKLGIAKAILRNNGTGRINLPNFRLYYKAYSHQESMVLAQRQKYQWNKIEINGTNQYIKKSIDQWNKIESPEINSHTYGHLIFDKGGKNIQWKKKKKKLL